MIADQRSAAQPFGAGISSDDLPDNVVARSEVVTVDGAEIVSCSLYPRSVSPRREIVVCHGTPWSAQMWMPLAAHLGRSHRVFLWDMPGYGRSIPSDPAPDSRDASGLSPGSSSSHDTPAEATPTLGLPTQSSRLAALIDHWGLHEPLVIAHDIGGAVALGAHLREGVDFRALYLLDIVTLSPWGSPFFRLVADNEAVFAALPPELHAALVRAYVVGAGSARLPGHWVEKLSEPWLTPAGQTAFYRQIASLKQEHTEPIAARLDQVRCRVHIGWGEADPWIAPEQADELHRLIPESDGVTRFPGTGHLVPVESPEDFSADVDRWLREAAPPRSD